MQLIAPVKTKLRGQLFELLRQGDCADQVVTRFNQRKAPKATREEVEHWKTIATMSLRVSP